MNDQVFVSPYAPLNRSGPLPPGLNERVIANAYKAQGILPKRVLIELGIRKYSATAAISLRRALDDSGNRDRIQTSRRVLPLHQVLYALLKEQPAYRTVYQRIVKPAEVEVSRSGHTVIELNSTDFESRIVLDQTDHSWCDHSICSQSEEEALVLFALAYGLLQQESAYEILKPVLSIGPAFRAYFGVDLERRTLQDSLPVKPTKSPDETLSPSVQAMATAEEPGTAQPGPTATATSKDKSQAAYSQIAPSDSNASAGTSEVPPYIGPRTQRVANLTSMLESRRIVRQNLGRATALDKSAFDSAYKAELAAIGELRGTEEELQVEWATLIRQWGSVAAGYGIELAFGSCPDLCDQIAGSLDRLASRFSELAEVVAALEARRNAAMALGIQLDSSNAKAPIKCDLARATDLLQDRLIEVTAVYERATHWQDVKAKLQTVLHDCTHATLASSLMKLNPEVVLELIDRTEFLYQGV